MFNHCISFEKWNNQKMFLTNQLGWVILMLKEGLVLLNNLLQHGLALMKSFKVINRIAECNIKKTASNNRPSLYIIIINVFWSTE